MRSSRGLPGATILLLCSAMLGGCQQPPAPAATADAAPAKTVEAEEIHWFHGSVEDAFAQARETGQPLFVYWGASWCPPCNQLSSTVFSRPDFIAQTRQYIAVHVDGDAPDAQRWAEHFGAMGYPTLIVFDAQGNELTRLSSGMELERYAQVLDSARHGRGMAALVEQGFADPAGLTADEWSRLAWYAWGVDQDRVLEPERRLALFARLRESVEAPSPLLRRRLELVWWLERDFQGQLDMLDTAEQRDGRSLLLEVLSHAADWRASLTDLEYGALPLIEALSEPGSIERDLLLQALYKAMDQAWEDPALGPKERILTVRVLIHGHRLEHGDAPLPAALADEVRRRVKQILAAAKTPHERQALVYYAAWYLHEIGDDETALATLEAELKTAIAPYYYMSYLAEIEQARGNADAALKWSGRAFATASGSATRLQWGMAHLHALLELSPDDRTAIEGVLRELQRIAAESPGSLYQRTRVRLERLNTPLLHWAQADAQRSQWLRDWRARWLQVCPELDAKSAAAKTCKNFLAAL